MAVTDPSALGSGPVSDLAAGATGGFEFETHSMMNQYPQSIYGKYSECSKISNTSLSVLK